MEQYKAIALHQNLKTIFFIPEGAGRHGAVGWAWGRAFFFKTIIAARNIPFQDCVAFESLISTFKFQNKELCIDVDPKLNYAVLIIECRHVVAQECVSEYEEPLMIVVERDGNCALVLPYVVSTESITIGCDRVVGVVDFVFLGVGYNHASITICMSFCC